MAKTIQLIPDTYSDLTYIEGVERNDSIITNTLSKHCRKYFEENYRGVFFCKDDDMMDIFQNTFVTFWENLEKGYIHIKDGTLQGPDRKPFRGSLCTYFMGIAKNKNKEWVRSNIRYKNEEERKINNYVDKYYADSIQIEMLYGTEEGMKLEIVSECLSKMKKLCNDIITKFYYDNLSMKELVNELDTFNEPNAVKNQKSRCMRQLRECSLSMYENYKKTQIDIRHERGISG